MVPRFWPAAWQRAGQGAGQGAGQRCCDPQTGGGSQQQRRGDHIPPVHFSLPLFGLFVLERTTRTAPAERERTGATPPFFAAGAARRGGVDHTGFHTRYHTPPAFVGVAPVLMYPCYMDSSIYARVSSILEG